MGNDIYTETVPYTVDPDNTLLKKIAASLSGSGAGGSGGTGGGSSNLGGKTYSSVPSTKSVGTTATELAPATTTGRRVAIYNNSGTQVLWFRIGGTPVADTGTIESPAGDGVGISLNPGGDWESPADFVNQVLGISKATCQVEVVISTPQ